MFLGVIFGRSRTVGGDPGAFTGQKGEVFLCAGFQEKRQHTSSNTETHFRIIFRKMALFPTLLL